MNAKWNTLSLVLGIAAFVCALAGLICIFAVPASATICVIIGFLAGAICAFCATLFAKFDQKIMGECIGTAKIGKTLGFVYLALFIAGMIALMIYAGVAFGDTVEAQ